MRHHFGKGVAETRVLRRWESEGHRALLLLMDLKRGWGGMYIFVLRVAYVGY